MTVAVDAINRSATRSLSHVGQEIFKGGTPPVANLNAASAVSLIIRRTFMSAPIEHSVPGNVCSRHAAGHVPMRSSWPVTRASSDVLQRLQRTNERLAASRAFSPPHRFLTAGFLLRPSVIRRTQKTEYLACYVKSLVFKSAPLARPYTSANVVGLRNKFFPAFATEKPNGAPPSMLIIPVIKANYRVFSDACTGQVFECWHGVNMPHAHGESQ